MTRRKRERRRTTAVRRCLVSALLATTADVAGATKNFCGLTWGAASSNCDNSQPCPGGLDEECTYGGEKILLFVLRSFSRACDERLSAAQVRRLEENDK